MIEKFVGFYTSRPFWAGDSLIDIETWLNNLDQPQFSETQTQFHESMSAIEFSYDTDTIRLCVCKDGMLLVQVKDLERECVGLEDKFDFELGAKLWGQYLDYVNCLYLLLDSVLIEIQSYSYFNLSEVTIRDVIRLQFEDGKCIGQNIAQESVASVYQLGRYSITNDTFITLVHRQSFSKNVFDALFAKYLTATADQRLLKSLAEIAKSLSEYKFGNYSTSLVLAWFVIESTLLKLWNEFLDGCNRDFEDGTRRISKTRNEILTGRDYTISIVSNFLELSGLIPFKTFQNINAVRGYRNKIVHGDLKFDCGAQHCQQAIDLALNLILEGTGLDVSPNYARSMSGL